MKGRMSQTTRDMTLSLLVVIGVVALVYFFTASTPDPVVRVVDYVPTATAARSTGAFDVALPVGLGPQWRATSVRYTPSLDDPKFATWHLGFLNPSDQYVALEQSNLGDPGFIKESTADGKRDGTQTVPASQVGTDWTRYYSETRGHRSLVSKSDGITTVVTGTVSYEELADFATSLRTS